MNTDRSDALLERFRQRTFKAVRKVIEMRERFPATPDEVFIQLCPTREADWIPGWDAELVYTESGYAEEHCVFRTDETCVSGPGVWVMSHVEPPWRLEIVHFLPSMVVNLSNSVRVSLSTVRRYSGAVLPSMIHIPPSR